MSAVEVQSVTKQDRWQRWAETHREERAAYRREYRARRREELNSRRREIYADRADEINEARRADREPEPAATRDRRNVRARERYSGETPDERRVRLDRAAAWRAANPILVQAANAAVNANRMARRRGVAGTITRAEVLALWERQPACLVCGVGRGVDHVIPMRAGGPNEPANLQNLCKPCNARKEQAARMLAPDHPNFERARKFRESRHRATTAPKALWHAG